MGFWSAYLPLVATISRRGEREMWYGFLAALRNIGFAVGGVAAALILDAEEEWMFHAAILLNAASFVVAIVLLLPTPDHRLNQPEDSQGSWRAVFSQQSYRWLLGTNTLYAILATSLAYAMPLYVLTMVNLPGYVGGLIFTINSLMIGFAQAPLMKRLTGWVRWQVVGAGLGLMAVSFVLLWVADLVPTGAAIACALIAAGIYALGEMTCDPVLTALAAEIAPEGSEGRAMSAYQLSWAVALAVAPVTYTWLLAQGAAAAWGGR
jgi:MFS family permease